MPKGLAKPDMARACAAIARMSAAHGIAPAAAVGLLCLEALAFADLRGLRLLKDAGDLLRGDLLPQGRI